VLQKKENNESMLDYHIHVAAHGEYKYTDAWVKAYLDNARSSKIKELGFLEHDEYLASVDSDLLARLRISYPDILIRRGLEVDYMAGREDKIKNLLAGQNLDYVIGSVHFIDGWGFDHPDYRSLFDNKDIDEVYAAYFALVEQASNAGLFDIIGHIDLVKIWGHRPVKKGIMYYLDPVLKSIKKAGLVVELNSAGLRKPVCELYPEKQIVDAMFAQNIPITLGSDAHHPEQVGEGLTEAETIARRAGYRYVTGFDRRKQYLVKLDAASSASKKILGG